MKIGKYLKIFGVVVLVGLIMTSSAAMAAVYDNFETDQNNDGKYDIEDYRILWLNPYGLGEMAGEDGENDTRDFSNKNFFINAYPFHTAYDFSVYDHIKYLAVSNFLNGSGLFPMPEHGTLTISADIEVVTPGAVSGHVIHGFYGDGDGGAWAYDGTPYEKALLEGQQACATLHLLNILPGQTGQLYDWLVSGTKAFCLVERLPSNVTDETVGSDNPMYVGLDKAYTQIVKEVDISPGVHNYAISYSRMPGDGADKIQFLIDGEVIATAHKSGIPLDVQNPAKYNNKELIYPSLGPGEILKDRLDGFLIGHGIFSLLDEFPFQHPDNPVAENVYIPTGERIFGQGAIATFDNIEIVIDDKQ